MALQARLGLIRNFTKRSWSCATAGRSTTPTPPSITAGDWKYNHWCTNSRRYDEDQLIKNSWSSKRFMANTAAGETSDGKQVAVETTTTDDQGRRRAKRRPPAFWRGKGREFIPALEELFPSSELGNALLQATENINRLFQNLNVSPSKFIGRIKEKDECYKLRYEVPGLSKEDLKITIHDGLLTIKGEHKEEAQGDGEDESDDEFWSARSYGFYHTTVQLPEDAKSDDIKAELKDGLLHITIPRTEKPKDAVKEVQIH